MSEERIGAPLDRFITGIAGEDIKAGDKILLCADGFWRKRISTSAPKPLPKKPKPAKKRKR